MTEATLDRRAELDRNLALLIYGLLISSVFFAGIPAVIAVVIAYAQRGEASAAVRSHHDFQIRIFWVAFAFSMIAAACVIGAIVVGIGDLLDVGLSGGWGAVSVDWSNVRINGVVVALAAGALLSSVLGGVWLLAAPAFGFIRLASERSIGNTAA